MLHETRAQTFFTINGLKIISLAYLNSTSKEALANTEVGQIV
jgi:hypothetical protein